MGNVTTPPLPAVATDSDCAVSQGRASFTKNISLISLSHLHHQISVKLQSTPPFPLKGQTSVTRSGEWGGARYSFTSKWGKKSDEGPKVLIKQSYFMGDAGRPPPPLCLWRWFEVTLGPFEAGSHQFATWWGEGNWRGRGGGAFFNCQVTWCRDRRSFGRIVCLCAGGRPSETPHLIKRKPRLIDKFSNWRPEDGIKSVLRPPQLRLDHSTFSL